ncbi:MAG TPA: DUF1016 N-terminal domain-containing protein, partial [bacterium]|nr:DUF1016 N-terminal domain-containing protein [bacterium]
MTDRNSYNDLVSEITQTPSGQLEKKKTQKKSGESEKTEMVLSDKITGQMIIKHLPLSWSHYVFLIGVKNEKERTFYEIEAANANWSLNELKRQFNSSLFERLALSKDKAGIRKMAEKEKNEQELQNGQPEMNINTDENLSGSTGLNEPVGEESEVEKLKNELEEAKDKYLRLAAEFDNFKRRNAKERIEMIQT